jgi:hypothetical protein
MLTALYVIRNIVNLAMLDATAVFPSSRKPSDALVCHSVYSMAYWMGIYVWHESIYAIVHINSEYPVPRILLVLYGYWLVFIGEDPGTISVLRLMFIIFNAGKRKMHPLDSGNVYPC